ncbi:MAG: S1C family serine protease [bacterium]|jgi:S1-C subfamily serine protease
MKLRALLIAALLVGGFVYLTSQSSWNPLNRFRPSPTGRIWSGPLVSEAAPGFSSDEQNNIEVYKMAHAATVHITSTVYRRTWFYEVIPQRGTGSGFIVNPDGRILTNNHVISGSQKIEVILPQDQSKYRATVLARDPRNDLALIQIQARKKLPFLRLGNSDTLQVGQKVLAIGNPFGLEGTLTTGIISSLNRTLQADDRGNVLEGMIQTDAAINPGNSGGPLLDSAGNVIGINTAIYGPGANIGIGFAMPIDRAKAMLDEVAAKGTFTPPRLGISVIYIAGDLAEALSLPADGGLLVVEIEEGSAADRAGLRGPRRWVIVGNMELPVGGDLITAIDGEPVTGQNSLSRAMAKKRVGEKIELTVFRNGREVKVPVILSAGTTSL